VEDVAESTGDAAADNYLALGERKQQFKLVRRYSYIALSVMVLALLYLTWLQNSPDDGTFYIPLPQIMFVMLFGALLLNLTSVVFGALEVYAASGGETRYLIARHGFSTGVVTAAFAAFFLIVIVALGPIIDDQIDYENSIQLGVNSFQSTVTAPFNVTSDYTGSSFLSWVEVDATNGVPFNLTVYQHDDYSSYCATANQGMEVLKAVQVTHFRLSFVDHIVETIPAANHTAAGLINWSRVEPYAEDERYMIVLERHESEASNIAYHQNRQLDPGFLSSVFTLLLGLIVLNAAAAVYNRIIREKWRAYGEKNL
jgi:hypothetical protein